MNTMLYFNINSKTTALRAIYNCFYLKTLTNPECSFISNDKPLVRSETYDLSKNKMPNTFENFSKQIGRKHWNVCLCVAGTDSTDSRRVVVTYMKDEQIVVVNFPSAVDGFSENELRIKDWLKKEFNNI